MKIISTTEARKSLGKIVDSVANNNELVFLGRRDKPEVVMMRVPDSYNKDVSDVTNVATASDVFDFLQDEPDLYSINDAQEIFT